MELYRRRLDNLMVVLFIFICFFLFPLEEGRPGEASSIPTIEDLTKGKVKIGDLIDKNNVDLVKEYLPISVYGCVQQGMVLIMGEHLTPDKLVPKLFWEATERNKGSAVMDEYGTVYLKNGSTWPGGLPFPEPKTGMEAMANVKHGITYDDFSLEKQWMFYINKEGELYKSVKMYFETVSMARRMRCAPLGTYPGIEDESRRRLVVFLSPLKMKGLGQLSVRYYDEGKKIDTGFAYLPAFKRTLRISATTWQDNIGGSDALYCDPTGINDPYVYWKFKLIEKKFMLTSATKPHAPLPLVDDDGKPDTNKIKSDVGQKYLRLPWAITPVLVVEATPTLKHVYGKKVFYVLTDGYWFPSSQIAVTDIYDRQMEIYKSNINWRGGFVTQNNDNFALEWGFDVHDLQTGHSSRNWYTVIYNECLDGTTVNLKKLLEFGK